MRYTVGDRDERPWGSWEVLDVGPTHVVKRICVTAGHRLSLQRHARREEKWVVVSGQGTASVGGLSIPVEPGDDVQIFRNTSHRLAATTDMVLIEVQMGECSEDDIERLDDDYGRI